MLSRICLVKKPVSFKLGQVLSDFLWWEKVNKCTWGERPDLDRNRSRVCVLLMGQFYALDL